MKRCLLTDAVLLDPEAPAPFQASLLLQGDRIEAHLDPTDPAPDGAEVIHLAGRQVAPGFIDLHFHGELAFVPVGEFHDALQRASASMARHGTTAFLATTLAWPQTTLADHVGVLASLVAEQRFDGAVPLGLHLEGPWISNRAAGAQPSAGIRPFDRGEGERVLANGEGLVRMVTLAPEIEGASELLDLLAQRGVCAALGHSLAEVRQIDAAAQAGMTHVTHLFNAMGPMHHRHPGVPGYVLTDDRFSCDLICDGVHVHPRLVKLAALAKPRDLLLITDRLEPPSPARSELSTEELRLGSEIVREAPDAWRLADQRLAGSSLTLDRAVANVQAFGAMDLLEAISACTLCPARLLGIEGERGRLRPGVRADLAILDAEGRIVETWIGGRRVFSSE